jgi:hypothetical protein
MKTTIKILAVFVLALALMLSGPAGTMYAKQGAKPKFPEKMKEQVKYLSTRPMLLRAATMGITTIEGKDISAGKPAKNKKGRGHDVPIGVNPVIHENEPTVAANPVDSSKLVAGSHYIGNTGNSCVAYTSSNGGASWTSPVAMLQLTESSFCSDPVLAFAPDGSRVYYTYMDIKSSVEETLTTITFTDDWDIVVSFSDDNGKTWTGPIMALDSDPTSVTFDIETGELLALEPGFLYDKPWISSPLDSAQKDWEYITATRFDNFGTFDCHITFTRSGDKSATWDAPTLLESSGGCNPVLQGSRPAGGKGGNVLAAWYNSGSDGWLAGNFQIRTRLSSNNGASWNNIVTAAADSYEAPFWLGPENFYHRWWGVMFPDVEIDGGGAAHIAYTHDPAQNPEPGFSDTPEDGDIRYITSSGQPYNSWSAPLTINDDGLVRAQGWATLETQTKNKLTTVYLIWEDHRLSPELPTVFPSSPNLYYDIFSAKKGFGSSGWFPNTRVSDVTSIVDFVFIGDYFDLTANDQLVFGIWTDRRDKTTIFDFEDDVFGNWKLK